MTTSGTYTYNVTATQIINGAFRKCGVLEEGETPSAEMSADALEALEIMIKGWHSEGLHLWKYEEMILFLVTSQESYDLGPSGGNWVKKSDLTTTALASDAASSATTITVDSITGVADADIIGVVIDDNTIHWTTVNGAPSGSTITLTTGLDGAASTDNAVYAYTTKGPRPLQVTDGRVQVESTSETILTMKGRNDYFLLSNKSSKGTPVEAYYSPRLTNGKLYIWPTVNDERIFLNLTTQIPIEDITSSSNNLDFPQEWFLPLVWCLSQQIYVEFGVNDQVTVQKIEKEADKWYEKVLDFDIEEADLILMPDTTGA